MADFGSYVEINNKTHYTWSLQSSDDGPGYWAPQPPSVINPNTDITFKCSDPLGPIGSSGSVVYQVTDSKGKVGKLTIAFACPYGDTPNSASTGWQGPEVTPKVVVALQCRTDDTGWQPTVPTWGHPIYLQVTLTEAA